LDSIKQIRELVAIAGSPGRDCTAARDVAKVRLMEVGRKLEELRALERSLRRFVEDCSAQCAGGPARECIILEDLASLRSPVQNHRSRLVAEIPFKKNISARTLKKL